MSRGIDLLMSLNTNDDWIRVSSNQARRKTDYEKQLEHENEMLKIELNKIQKMSKWDRAFYKPNSTIKHKE